MTRAPLICTVMALALAGCGNNVGHTDFAEPVAPSTAVDGNTAANRNTAAPRPPRVRMGVTEVSGALPPELVQQVVQEHFELFNACFQPAFRDNPKLRGRAELDFLIDEEGLVSGVKGSGDLPDQSIIDCVVTSFGQLEFPPPQSGTVTVSYAFTFAPGN